MVKEDILEKASFEDKDGVKIFRMRGTPFEMGYQHGYLLAERISIMINTSIQATIAYIALATDNDLATAEQWFWLGQKAAEPFLPEEFKEEMQGIVAGCNDAGIHVSEQQIYLWNTNFDQWCIYAHPHYWRPREATGKRESATDMRGAGGCSSFSAWPVAILGDVGYLNPHSLILHPIVIFGRLRICFAFSHQPNFIWTKIWGRLTGRTRRLYLYLRIFGSVGSGRSSQQLVLTNFRRPAVCLAFRIVDNNCHLDVRDIGVSRRKS